MDDKEFLFTAFTDSMDSVSKVNTETGELEFIKNNDAFVESGKCYSFAEYVKKGIIARNILDSDIYKFNLLMDLQAFREKCSNSKSVDVINYRKIINGEIKWARVILFVPDNYSKENPYVLIARRDLHDREVENQNILSQVGEKTNKIIASNINQRKTNKALIMGEEVDITIILKQFSLSFIGNLLSVMSFFIRQYLEFFMVDLDKDHYIALKIEKSLIDGRVPLIGNYSENVLASMREKYGKEAEEIFENLDTPAKLKKLLKDKLVLEYKFKDKDGEELILYITRIESTDGVPTKILIRMNHFKSSEKLKVKTFGNFEVLDADSNPVKFKRSKSKQVLAYLIDRHGYKVSTKDIVVDVLEKEEDDINAIKYVSTLVKGAISDLEQVGFRNIIIKEWNSYRINVGEIDCDYYRYLDGDLAELNNYHNEYMKEYSWAEVTNAEIMTFDL